MAIAEARSVALIAAAFAGAELLWIEEAEAGDVKIGRWLVGKKTDDYLSKVSPSFPDDSLTETRTVEVSVFCIFF